MGRGDMISIHIKFLAVAACTAALSGCVSAGSGYQVENATGRPIPHHALADEVYLDGTGVTARRLAQPQPGVERRYAEPLPAGAPTRAIVRSRPTAIERADSVSSSSTTGSRTSVQADASKPFSDQWWEKERREDERLKRIMDICRGC